MDSSLPLPPIVTFIAGAATTLGAVLVQSFLAGRQAKATRAHDLAVRREERSALLRKEVALAAIDACGHISSNLARMLAAKLETMGTDDSSEDVAALQKLHLVFETATVEAALKLGRVYFVEIRGNMLTKIRVAQLANGLEAFDRSMNANLLRQGEITNAVRGLNSQDAAQAGLIQSLNEEFTRLQSELQGAPARREELRVQHFYAQLNLSRQCFNSLRLLQRTAVPLMRSLRTELGYSELAGYEDLIATQLAAAEVETEQLLEQMAAFVA